MLKLATKQFPLLNYIPPYQAAHRADKTSGKGKTFTYLMAGTMGAALFSNARSIRPASDVAAAGKVEVNLGDIPEGTCATIKWRGKPVFIHHRTPKQIQAARDGDNLPMRDPAKDADRADDPRYMILLGICPHLGCVPVPTPTLYSCPCHGSKFDLAGRIIAGPAPKNLERIPYKLQPEDNIVILGA